MDGLGVGSHFPCLASFSPFLLSSSFPFLFLPILILDFNISFFLQPVLLDTFLLYDFGEIPFLLPLDDS